MSHIKTDDAVLVARWDEGGFTDYLNEDAPTIVRELDGRTAALLHVDTRKVVGYRVYDAAPAMTSPQELAERLRTDAAYLRKSPRVTLGTIGLDCQEAADSLDALSARIAELERDNEVLQRDVTKFQAIAEDKLGETRLLNAGPRTPGEGFGFDFSGGPIPYIAEYLFQFIGARDDDKPMSNYAEIEVRHREFGAMTLTLQRHSGQTPHQLRQAAEASLAKAVEALERCEAVLRHADPFSTTDGDRIPETTPGMAAEMARTTLSAIQNKEAGG